jgi:hypothetical protein
VFLQLEVFMQLSCHVVSIIESLHPII